MLKTRLARSGLQLQSTNLRPVGSNSRTRAVQRRGLATTRPLCQEQQNQQQQPQQSPISAQEETHDVTTIDRLTCIIRSRSHPAYRSIMPMRTPRLWSEDLIDASRAKDTPGALLSPPSTSTPTAHPHEPRYMHDSYSQIILPFASSSDLMEQYVNAWGGIRTGKLMEHLDSLAGSVAYKHILGPGVETLGKIKERGFYVVTASIDRLDMISPLYPVHDIRLSGNVIYTGKSSMEIVVKMEALEANGSERTLMLGRFSMVCRDAITHKAREVNPLIISTPEEHALHKIGEALKVRRQDMSQHSLTRVPPSSEEAAALHHLYLCNLGETNVSKEHPYETVWMGDTKLERCMLMFPQERNVHSKVFGGYLMRLAYELGFANVTLFTRTHTRFISLDGISFARPVPIGSILRLTSQIAHSSASAEYPALVHVHVKANVVDVPTGSEQTTNDFKFTWCREEGEPLNRMVVPRTYSEAMLWIEGKRALEMGAEIRGLRR